jgi:hypothetical protein
MHALLVHVKRSFFWPLNLQIQNLGWVTLTQSCMNSNLAFFVFHYPLLDFALRFY